MTHSLHSLKSFFSKCALPAVLIALSFTVYAGKKDDTLVYASDNEVENISPYHNHMREGVIIAHLVWDTLVHRDPQTNEYKPQLATGWKWESPLALVLNLRRGVKFHNGDAFTADDVVFTFGVVGPGKESIQQQSFIWIDKTEKIDDYTVRLRLKKPFPAALEYLSGPMPIYPAKYFQKVSLAGYSKAPVGTGPYRITAITPAQGVTMEKNPEYFKESPLGQPRIGKLKFVVISDPESRVAQLMTGQVDWIWRVSADQAAALKTFPNFTVKGGETMRVGFIQISPNVPGDEGTPFKDLRVRQAVNHAINRAGMAENLVRGGSRPVWSACYDGQVACDTREVVRYDYNPEKAKKLLAEAGYPNGFDTGLWAYRERDYAEAIIGDLRKVGIRARLHFVKLPVMDADQRSGKAPMGIRTWGSLGINDASAFTAPFFGGKGNDLWRDAEVVATLNKADETIDPKQRSELYAKALGRISMEAMSAPLFTYSINYAYSTDLNFDAWPDELPRFYMSSWK
ncbi:MAG: ABC transporter substrate-binding protein [Candidatus Accumulibacter sp.]|jgi:peptide/nickel transport system substrate-binding protein|nr:ABC transporter substrate-binding protein [Accumulibacter sp.]